MSKIIDTIDKLTNIIALDENGIPTRVLDDKAVNYIINLLHPISFSAKEDIFYYENGVYNEGGIDLIKQILNKGLLTFRNIENEPIITIKQSNEIIEKIKYLCMDDRSNFDKDLAIINMKNGLYNWQTREFKPHTYEYKSLIQIPVEFDINATCPTIETVFHEIIPEKYYELCLEYIGYLLYRSYSIQSSLLLYGPGGTGKSVFLQVLKNFVGEKNCISYSLQKLVESKYALGDLYNKLLNECGDLDATAISKTGVFKAASGRDILTIDRKYKDAIKFINFAKFVFSTNIIPPVNDNSDGFSRRVIIIMFLRKYLKEEYDYNRIEKMNSKEELSGLFNLVIAKLPALIERSYFTNQPSPDESQTLYMAASNPLLVFARQCIFEDPNSYGMFKSSLYMEYVKFCQKYKTTPLVYNDFNKEIQKHATYLKTGQKINRELGKKQTSWHGVSLTHAFD